jgi:hypothetical protein
MDDHIQQRAKESEKRESHDPIKTSVSVIFRNKEILRSDDCELSFHLSETKLNYIPECYRLLGKCPHGTHVNHFI